MSKSRRGFVGGNLDDFLLGSDSRYLLAGCICRESNEMKNKETEATNATILGVNVIFRPELRITIAFIKTHIRN